MSGWDGILLPMFIMYLLIQIQPMMMEIYAYYLRGGLVEFDHHLDTESWHSNMTALHDFTIYFKRFLDRPTSDTARAYYAWMDWSAIHWDKSIYIHRRTMARGAGEVTKFRWGIYGPFRFNWKAAHDKQWLRGDDAAGYKMPYWGNGGEARARKEFTEAKDKCYDKYWHYQIMRKVRREQAAKSQRQAEEEAIAIAK